MFYDKLGSDQTSETAEILIDGKHFTLTPVRGEMAAFTMPGSGENVNYLVNVVTNYTDGTNQKHSHQGTVLLEPGAVYALTALGNDINFEKKKPNTDQ